MGPQLSLFDRRAARGTVASIEEVLRSSIIEPSDSPWASVVVMVNKKWSPKMRFCVDNRPLNNVTRTRCLACFWLLLVFLLGLVLRVLANLS